MGLSNEISFILIFLAVPVQQVKMFCSKLAVRRYLSSSVGTVVEKTNGTGRDLCSKWPILTKL